MASIMVEENKIKKVLKGWAFYYQNTENHGLKDEKEFVSREELLRCLVELDSRNKLMYVCNEN